MKFSYIDAILNDKWDELKVHVEKLSAQKIVDKINEKKVEVLKTLNTVSCKK